MPRIVHGGVSADTEAGVLGEELLVAQVQQVDLGVVQRRVHVLVQLTIPETGRLPIRLKNENRADLLSFSENEEKTLRKSFYL